MKRETSPLIATLAGRFAGLQPGRSAERLERLRPPDCADFLARQPTPVAATLLGRLTPDFGVRVLESSDAPVAATWLAAMEPQRGANLIARLDAARSEDLLAKIDPASAEELRQLASYPPDCAGSLMDPVVLALHPGSTVAEALKRLRRFRDRRVHHVYVVEPDGRLVGALPLRELATAETRTRLADLPLTEPIAVQATASREEVVDLWTQHRMASLPVVDFEGRLVGVVRNDALIESTQEEASASLQSMVGAGRQEQALSKVSFAVRKRLPWLQVNLATAFLAASVVGLFEDTIARYTALAVLLPVVAGQSGNTGAQALAVTMRGLVLREVRLRQWLRVCSKEFNVALLNSIAVALTTSAAVLLWSRSAGLALVIGSSMIISMSAAGLSGAAIPLLLTSIRQDPAQSSSIILTTVTDVVGFFSFLGIATLLSGML